MKVALWLLPAALLAFGLPFWEAKPPSEWTFDEAQSLLTNSPWAQSADAGKGGAPGVQVYLASADPVIQAEDRVRAARKSTAEDPSWTEYRDYLVENTGKSIVLAVAAPKPEALADANESRHMEDESLLRIGKRTYKMTGHFPPTRTDSFVRFVFPADIRPGDRTLRFDLYVPGTGAPYRTAEFRLRDLVYHGRPAY
jgi:hypothetical protein